MNKPRLDLHAARSKTTNGAQALTLAQARRQTQQYPQQASGWRALGIHLLSEDPKAAANALNRAMELEPENPITLELLARAEYAQGNEQEAMAYVQQALNINPSFSQGHLNIANLLFKRGQFDQALAHIDLADQLASNNSEILSIKANTLYRLYRYDEALEIFEELIHQHPKNYIFWNNGGNVKRDLGLLTEADNYYKQSTKLAKDDSIPFSNRITTLHYRTDYSRDAIFQVCKEWQTRFAPSKRPIRPRPENITKNRRIRIGLFSDGFRGHPVGWMVTAALENIAKHEIELYAYTTNGMVDPLTLRIQNSVEQWIPIQHLSEEAFAERIMSDHIDILIDLCGHNTGNRMRTMTREPAPLLLKWVGGLINTTGLDAIDYLLTDSIESPVGEDNFYTEKLIRLPDDYICYLPPTNLPQVASLPALKNGYITLGCFNNPIKINEVTLTEWAELMLALPGSHLFLKGHQYNSKQVCDRVRALMLRHGIGEDRLILEGPSDHKELFQAYNRVDIALDPWPYSGGLTTCEAMLMGVPVVTLPGPTFAGRHSATHLVNAGMPELVVNSWDEYRERVLDLASDLTSLATIRTHLRDILLQSPVCDGPRFAKHFSTAMRAIWQRYCDNKTPQALTLDKEGQAWFDGDTEPVEIQQPSTDTTKEDSFNFSFNDKVVVLDNGASLVGDPGYSNLHKLGVFSTIVFDPAGVVSNASYLQQYGELHCLPHTTLGDGNPATLFNCLNPAMSATLEPLPNGPQTSGSAQDTQVIAKLTINTHRLDAIEGVENVDWLLLDNLNDSVKILENGVSTLANTLLVQTRINFIATHQQQPEFGQISNWLIKNGFCFYRFNNPQHNSLFPDYDHLIKQQATQLVSTDAIFVPSTERMATLTDNQRQKLAFLLHTVYGIHDLTCTLLVACQIDNTDGYLRENGYLSSKPKVTALKPSSSIPETPRMSTSETDLFEKYLKKSHRYFEFGSGGSTKMAARYGKTIFGVESDEEWVAHLKNETGPLCKVEYVNIGPTKEWGYPVDNTHQKLFKNYSQAIQNHSEQFDLILVDGRFRVACAVNAIQQTLRNSADPRSTYIFIHDFWDRPHYHGVLKVLEEVDRAETAGVFRIRENASKAALQQLLNKHLNDPN